MGAVVCDAGVIRTTTKLAVRIKVIGRIMGKLLLPPLFARQALARRLLLSVRAHTSTLRPPHLPHFTRGRNDGTSIGVARHVNQCLVPARIVETGCELHAQLAHVAEAS